MEQYVCVKEKAYEMSLNLYSITSVRYSLGLEKL
jgi:hypothetical protein